MRMHRTSLPPRRLAWLLLAAACVAPRPEPDGSPGAPENAPESAPENAPENAAGRTTEPATESAATIVLAEVNGEPLTLEGAMNAFLPSHTGHGVLARSAPALHELAARLVERKLFLAEAETLGVPEDPELQRVVADYGRSLAEIEFWKREVDDRVSVPDEEVEAFWDKTDLALSLSLLRVDDRARAEALRAEVLAGADFAELASSLSTHPSASFGGALPYVRRGELPVEIEEPVFALEEPGQVTPVLETDEGFVFVRLDERSTNPIRPDRAVAIPQIRGILESRVEDELRASVEERLDRESGARVVEELLARDVLLSGERGDRVVAEASGETLTLDGLRELLNLDAVRAATDEEVAEAVPEIARGWTRQRAVAREAAAMGLDRDPELLRKLEGFRADAILRTLYRDYVYADAELEEADVRAYWEENREAFTRPPELRLAYLVVAERGEAEEALRRLAAGEDFEVVARDVSIDATSAAHGGRIGWVRPGQVLPEVEEAAFALAVGDLGGPIETELGWFVLHALDRKEAVPIPYEVARRVALERLTEERQREAYASWALALRDRADVEIFDEGIRRAAEWIAENEPAEDGPVEGPGPGVAPPPGHGGGTP